MAAKSLLKLSDEYQKQNEICAAIIAADPGKYPIGGLMQEWADAVLGVEGQPDDSEAGPLFAAA